MLQPKTGLNDEQKERLKVVLAETTVGKAYASLSNTERRSVNRELTKERIELTEELPKRTRQGRLWLFKRKVN